MVTNDMYHWGIEVSNQEIEVIGREVAAANQEIDFGQLGADRIVVKVWLYEIGNGEEF